MKKLLLSLLAGSILIGVGLGMTALEVSAWDIADYPLYLDEKPVETVEKVEELDVNEFEKVYIYETGHSNGFRKDRRVEIVEDETCTDIFKVKIDYKGELPQVYFYSYDDEDRAGNVGMRLDYIIHPSYNHSIREIREIAEDMFENKVLYTDNITTLITKITIHTAYPEKFVTVYQ